MGWVYLGMPGGTLVGVPSRPEGGGGVSGSLVPSESRHMDAVVRRRELEARHPDLKIINPISEGGDGWWRALRGDTTIAVAYQLSDLLDRAEERLGDG